MEHSKELNVKTTGQSPTLELICGPSRTGKTTFTRNLKNEDCMDKLRVNVKDQVYGNIEQITTLSEKAFKNLTLDMLNWIFKFSRYGPIPTGFNLFLNYRIKGPPIWDHRWETIKIHPIKKRAIILCISESEWRRRIERREKLKRISFGTFYDQYKDTYIKWIEELDRYNIPYIFIEGKKENNYPVISKSDFLKILDES